MQPKASVVEEYSVRLHYYLGGAPLVLGAFTLKTTDFEQLRKDFSSYITSGSPRVATYPARAGSPMTETFVVVSFQNLVALGGI